MKKYKTIIADPPWNYNNSGCRGACENHYQTMKAESICELPIIDFADSDCVLLLWCTWPQMKEGLMVLESWGFEYITGFPWIKITDISQTLWGEFEFRAQYGVGFWARGCSEFLLIGRRGKPKLPSYDFVGLLSPNLKHSRKPIDIYHYAESLEGPHLELFARGKRDGWDVYGNEVESDIVFN